MITARYAREIPQRYRFEATKCAACGEVSFPPRIVCPKCRGKKFEAVQLPNEGKLLTYTVIRVGPDKFSKETPYVVGIVELAGGVRITAQVADIDPNEVKVGQKVRVVFRKIQEDGRAGILCYGYKAIAL